MIGEDGENRLTNPYPCDTVFPIIEHSGSRYFGALQSLKGKSVKLRCGPATVTEEPADLKRHSFWKEMGKASRRVRILKPGDLPVPTTPWFPTVDREVFG